MTRRPPALHAFALRRTPMCAVPALVWCALAIGCASNPPTRWHRPADAATFQRIATFPVFLNTGAETETSAEIVAAAEGGNLLVYTDGANNTLGFIDIRDPAHPQPAGTVALGGEPTSVGVVGDFALALVNTSPDFVNTSGLVQVIDIDSRQILRSIEIGGQPDAIAISPDRRYAAIAIENERNEDLGDGQPPQLPGGFVVILDIEGEVDAWSPRRVELAGVPDLFPDDPEPEFVDINARNQAVVTLQENNHIAVIDLPSGRITDDFSAGTVDLRNIDTHENGLIEQTASLQAVTREPDAIAWIADDAFATANEGDLSGGTRGFTIFRESAGAYRVAHDAGSTVEHIAAQLGHYPETRSENKGNEPEGVEYGRFGRDDLLFVGSERANLVLVYRVPRRGRPELLQALPTGVAPEGLLAIPQRDLFVVASELDARKDKVRSSVTIYRRQGVAAYPDIVSAGATPIPWGALSGLAPDRTDNDQARSDRSKQTVYAIHDGAYRKTRIYTLDVARTPAIIESQRPITDPDGVLADLLDQVKSALPDTDAFIPANLVNDDHTVNLDLEGIESHPTGKYIVASEGAGDLNDGVDDPDHPFAGPNLIVVVNQRAEIEIAATLPLELTRNQRRFGIEGVCYADGYIYVAFQRAWRSAGDPAAYARIGRYDPDTGAWAFAYYPLDEPTSPAGGWVGLSEITSIGDGWFLVLERDNQGGPDARVKRVYAISIGDVAFGPNRDAPNLEVLEKRLIRDLYAEGDLTDTNGFVPEKLEGLTILDGDILIVNDAVNANSGETRLYRIAE